MGRHRDECKQQCGAKTWDQDVEDDHENQGITEKAEFCGNDRLSMSRKNDSTLCATLGSLGRGFRIPTRFRAAGETGGQTTSI